MILPDYTHDFFDFEGVVYLNAAYHGALPRVAVAAAEAALRLKQAPHRLRDEYHFDFPDRYRRRAAALIGARPDEVAVTDSCTHGIMLLAAGLDWRAADEVVVPADEFPANLFPWLSLERRGVVIRRVEIDRASDAADRIEQALTPRTRVVSVSWVSYTSGRRLDLRAIGERCRAHGVLLATDATQGAGGLPLDVSATLCDLVACAGYKWLLGPYGLGFTYVAPALAERLTPPNVNWFAIDGARDFSRLGRCRFAYGPGSRRFDVNEAASFTNVAAGIASLEYVASVGPAAVEQHVRRLHDRITASLPAAFRVVSETQPAYRSNILCIAADGPEATARASERLRAAGVVVSLREGAIRISPHLYNSDAEVDRLLECLRAGEESTRRVMAGPLPLPPVGAPVTGPETAGRPGRTIRRGRYVTLAPVDPARDVAELYAGSHGSEAAERVWTYMAYGPFPDEAAMRAWLDGVTDSSDPLFLTVRDAMNQPIGMVSFLNIVPPMRRLELGHIWYIPRAQRTEANTEAVYLMLAEAFDDLGCRRVEWKCDALNARSREAAVRLGFAFEGVFRQHMVVKGRNRDTAWYAMTDRDWVGRRVDFERWLGADAAERVPLGRG